MVSEPSMDSDGVSVRLNSKNFALWEFQFQIFVQGKGLAGILDGTDKKPSVPPATAAELALWVQNNAKVMTWLLNSVDSSIVLGLRLLPDAHSMWKHLATTYSTTNTARQFELEFELARLHQGDMDVTAYFNAARLLWTEQDLLTASLRSKEASEEVKEERNQSRMLQFLMKLHPRFEAVRSQLIKKDELKIDGLLGSLIREETRLRTQTQLDMRPGEGEAVFAAITADSGAGSGTSEVLAVNRPQFQQRRTPSTELKCNHCHVVGHLQKHCRQRNICNYCKAEGHIILECPVLKAKGKVPHPPRAGPQVNAIQLADSEGSLMTTEAVERLVNAAIQRSLPTAVNSAFSALQNTGFEDGAPSRKGE
ncbi:unnamed protein product [Linum tenue]|uniref:CCHC-type domain-containing protein n=1 Tax=Linum tenue TaxID=586396 RepID=A0AAV0L6B8_9ROSI|nr:unnamed protein product [Linum tenue]